MKTKIFSMLTLFVLMLVGLFVLPTPGLCADEITHTADSTTIFKDKDGVLLKSEIEELVKADFTGSALEFEIVSDQYSGNGNVVGEYNITIQAKSGEDTLRKTYKIKVVDELYFDYYYNNKFYVTANKNVTKENFVKALKLLEIIPNIDLSMTIQGDYFDYTGDVGTSIVTYQYLATSGEAGNGELTINVLEEAIFDLSVDKDYQIAEHIIANWYYYAGGLFVILLLAVVLLPKKKSSRWR